MQRKLVVPGLGDGPEGSLETVLTEEGGGVASIVMRLHHSAYHQRIHISLADYPMLLIYTLHLLFFLFT